MKGGAGEAVVNTTKETTVRTVQSVLEDRAGSILVSVLLGLGLAIIFFRRVCRGDQCVVVKSPGKDVLQDHYYKLEDDCYKYVPYAVKCGDEDEK